MKILVIGAAGSGTTTLGQALGARLTAAQRKPTFSAAQLTYRFMADPDA